MENIVAIINAQGVLNDAVDPNIEILIEEGFLILEKKKVQLTADQVARLNIPEADAPLYYSGPVIVLLLSHEDAFNTMNEIFPQLDDIYYTHTTYLSLRDQQFLFPCAPLLERTLCVLKPGYSQEDLSLLVDAFTEQGFVMLGKVARVLPLDIAQTFSSSTDAAQTLASEVSVLFALEKPNAVIDLQLLLGPSDPDEARLHAPFSLRARLGRNIVHNGAYASASITDAQRDLSLCFPHPFPIERTILILKPHAMAHLALVRARLLEAGFTIIAHDTPTLSPSRVESLFAHLQHAQTFTNMVTELSIGPCAIWLLARAAAVTALRTLVGPTDPMAAARLMPTCLSLALNKLGAPNALETAVDASDALRLARALFPHVASDAPLTAADVDALLHHAPGARASLQATLAKGLAELCRVKPQGYDAVRWLAQWLLRHNPNKPEAESPIVSEPDSDVSVALHTPLAHALATKTNAHKPLIITSHKSEIGPSALSITTPLTPRVVLALAGPGAAPPELLRSICGLSGVHYVDVPSLVQAALAQNTDVARILAKHHRLGRPAPSHITVKLIQDAIAPLRASTIMLAQCPLSLGDALMLESAGLVPHCLLMLTCSEDAAVSRLMVAQDAPVLRKELEDTIAAFAEQVQPVLEHYATFDKIIITDTDDTTATSEDLARAAAITLTAALRTAEPADKRPLRPRGPPKKKVIAVEDDDNF